MVKLESFTIIFGKTTIWFWRYTPMSESEKDRERGARDGAHDKQRDSSTAGIVADQVFGHSSREGSQDYKDAYAGARGKKAGE